MARPASDGIRVIAGRWRGTRIAVADRAQLRPTPDRVRETLFNWLAPALPGARCLDLFAGSGVLGIEALSRGAALCDAIELDPALVLQITAVSARLAAVGYTAHRANAITWLAQPAHPYDLVFIDPPFHAGLVTAVLDRVVCGWLAPQALVYVECERAIAPAHPQLSAYRAGTTQQISYSLLRFTP